MKHGLGSFCLLIDEPLFSVYLLCCTLVTGVEWYECK